MILHIVLFRPRAAMSAADRQSFVETFEAALREIRSIHQVKVGRRILHGRGYERLMRDDFPYAAILEFESPDALQAYLQHRSHDRLGAMLFEHSEAVLIYDYALVTDLSTAEVSDRRLSAAATEPPTPVRSREGV